MSSCHFLRKSELNSSLHLLGRCLHLVFENFVESRLVPKRLQTSRGNYSPFIAPNLNSVFKVVYPIKPGTEHKLSPYDHHLDDSYPSILVKLFVTSSGFNMLVNKMDTSLTFINQRLKEAQTALFNHEKELKVKLKMIYLRKLFKKFGKLVISKTTYRMMVNSYNRRDLTE